MVLKILTTTPPAFGVEYILEKICNNQGYTLNNQIKSTYNFPDRALIIPFTAEEWKRDYNGSKYNCKFGATTTTPSTFLIGKHIQFNTLLSTPTSYVNNAVIPTWLDDDGRRLILLNDEISFDWKYTITVHTDDDENDFFARIWVNNTPLLTFEPDLNSGNSTFTIGGHCPLAVPSADYFNAVGIWMEIGPITVDLVSAELTISNVQVKNPTDVIRSATGPVSAQFCALNGIRPDIKQSDLFKAYCQLFCGFVQVNEVDKQVSLIPFNSIAKGINEAVNWSDKLNITDEPVIKFLPDTYAQLNTFDWGYSENDIPPTPGYAKGTISINNQNLPAEYKAVELGFNASRQIYVGSPNHMCKIPVFDNSGALLGQAGNRLIFLEFRNVFFNYTDGYAFAPYSTQIPFTYFTRTGNNNGLSFNDNLLSKHYNQFAAVLDNYRQVTCKLRLNAADINRLDFTRPVYIKHFNAYFYINTIKGYNPMQPGNTTVELIKLF